MAFGITLQLKAIQRQSYLIPSKVWKAIKHEDWSKGLTGKDMRPAETYRAARRNKKWSRST